MSSLTDVTFKPRTLRIIAAGCFVLATFWLVLTVLKVLVALATSTQPDLKAVLDDVVRGSYAFYFGCLHATLARWTRGTR